MRELQMVGSDVDHFECPWCFAHDRERHLLMYMSVSGLLESIRMLDILHFAPERHISKVISAGYPKRYIKADLYPNSDDVERVDLMAIPSQSESFDLVIANHVLEHVADDLGALS
jgi:hypothetical protein